MTSPLDNLQDFYQPPPPVWTPQTAGWYVLFGVVAILIVWVTIYSIRRWLANRYRREALRQLALLPPEQFSTLLKRTSLTAWPREKVASLTSKTWLDFLNTSASGELFRNAPGNRIEEVALQRVVLSPQDEQYLRKLAAEWIRRHRVQA